MNAFTSSVFFIREAKSSNNSVPPNWTDPFVSSSSDNCRVDFERLLGEKLFVDICLKAWLDIFSHITGSASHSILLLLGVSITACRPVVSVFSCPISVYRKRLGSNFTNKALYCLAIFLRTGSQMKPALCLCVIGPRGM